jgi:predicted aspartyl protease
MTMPPPETLSAAYELAIRTYAVSSEISKQSNSKDRQYRARAVGVANVAPPSPKDRAESTAMDVLQMQIVELQVAVQEMAAAVAIREPTTTTQAATDQTSRPSQTTSTNVVCFNCHQPGHIMRNCPKKRAKQKAGTLGPSQANVLTMRTRRRVSVYVAIRYQGKEYRALLDTGCDVSVMSSRILLDVAYQESSQQMLTANNSPVPILGTATVAFTIGKLQVTHQFLVSDAFEENILGSDSLESHKCIWNFEESHLTIRSGTEQVTVELCAVNRHECVRRLYASIYRRNTTVQPDGHRGQDSLINTTTASKLDD